MYYVSKRLLDIEIRYPLLEKLALALVVSSRKLRHYFLAHPLDVFTSFPLKQVLRKPEFAGRMLKWSVELSEFCINYRPHMAIKGQALADFIVEFTYDFNPNHIEDKKPRWKLYVDGSSNVTGAGAGLLLISLENHMICRALRFNFKASKNEAEYEAVLAELRIAKELKVEAITVYSESQLVVSQMNGKFQARNERMSKYLDIAKDEVSNFVEHEVMHILWVDNSNADALAKLVTSRDAELLKIIPLETLFKPSISPREELMIDEV